MRLSEEQRKEFCCLIEEIITSEEFCKMKSYKHHLHGNTYEHCINVAYLCYLHYLRRKSRINVKELVRGALLHDYFLYDWRKLAGEFKADGLFHGFLHPKRALKNALKDYPNLTKTERDIIGRHMFPLTPVPPKTLCGWLVCFYDKVAAVHECFSQKNLCPLL